MILAADAADPVRRWLASLEERHLANLSFVEVTRALRALSSCYVQRRHRLGSGAALEGAGKRAAFALFYGPLHLLTVKHIVESLRLELGNGTTIVDLGCGSGAAGAAWALASSGRAAVAGIDRHPWAVGEAEWTWRTLGVRGHATRGDVTRQRWPGGRRALVAAFTVNELSDEQRRGLLERVLRSVEGGDALLLVEPIARAVAPWWEDWADGLARVGGEQRTWRTQVELPDIVERLDRAAGLNHRELTARSIHITPAVTATGRRVSAPRPRRSS